MLHRAKGACLSVCVFFLLEIIATSKPVCPVVRNEAGRPSFDFFYIFVFLLLFYLLIYAYYSIALFCLFVSFRLNFVCSLELSHWC